MQLPFTEKEWEAELAAFFKDYGLPSDGAWAMLYPNMGLIGANKQLLFTGVGTPGSVHDCTLQQSSPVFNEIESGNIQHSWETIMQ